MKNSQKARRMAMAAVIVGVVFVPAVYGQAPVPDKAGTASSAAPAATRPSSGEVVIPALPLFIVQLTAGPAWTKGQPADTQAGYAEHSKNLARLRGDGLLVMGARYKDGTTDKDMIIVRAASRDAVIAEFAGDPMVKDKKFNLDVADFQPVYDGFVARPERTAAATDAPLASLNWLAGCWFGSNGRTQFREQWMRAAGGVMLGMGHTTTMVGKMLSFEAMRIELDATGIPVFVAKPSDQTEASFKSVKYDATSIFFENPTHDFPQRIKYQLKADGTLDARIEGVLKGREARIEFPMRRASCE